MPETLFLQFTFHLHSNCFTTLRTQMHELNTLEALPKGGGGGPMLFFMSEFLKHLMSCL